MSMFNVTGELRKVYRQERTDRETGEVQVEHRANILGEIPTRDGGDTRLDLQDIRIPTEMVADMKAAQGKVVTVPIGFFAAAKNQMVVFIPKGSRLKATANA